MWEDGEEGGSLHFWKAFCVLPCHHSGKTPTVNQFTAAINVLLWSATCRCCHIGLTVHTWLIG